MLRGAEPSLGPATNSSYITRSPVTRRPVISSSAFDLRWSFAPGPSVSLNPTDAACRGASPNLRDTPSAGDPLGPGVPGLRRLLELSLREALALSHNYIGTEHILLGLIREGEGVAAQVLAKLGADLDRVRQQVVELLSGYAGGKEAPEPAERAQGGYVPVSQEALVTMVAGGPGVYQEQEAPELVRVVPLAREIPYGPGLRILLISLEIWRDWFDLRYAVLPERAPDAPPDLLLGWRVSDDAGTAYQQTGIATAGGRLLHISQLGFRPAPPEAARTLTLTVVDGHAPESTVATVEIDLPAAA
jgi:Clp amino terminal domain, pathogenicity island component